MEILIDTNFAITCTKQKIDFFNLTAQIFDEQIIWYLPEKVLEEIKKISLDKTKKFEDREAARLFLDLLLPHIKGKTELKLLKLKIENVDDAIKDYCKKNPEVVLATLDKGLKSKIKNRIFTIRGKNFLALV
jgi:rRNA-processing protein FCF1